MHHFVPSISLFMASVSFSVFFSHLATSWECSFFRSESFCCKTLFSMVPLINSSFNLSVFLFFNAITSFNLRISCSLLFSSFCRIASVFNKASSWLTMLPPMAPLLS
uniref:Putative uncharacterized protein YMR158W-B n=1 Tax=Saccharomyces cerevisiae (strain ATCC 204508 / S288c) TaxID=559292 RepID=YM158_YEAST|nr:RecName: Full=Putative uncharacterized protein YMR158W-B; Flags: Precursor [Saccharomyces cerevisiae S288C]pir/S69868/ hypothetical protein YMR158w-a - yeast (Saccharomyces cerevisiae) [Saccharomyces cerevisiae]